MRMALNVLLGVLAILGVVFVGVYLLLGALFGLVGWQGGPDTDEGPYQFTHHLLEWVPHWTPDGSQIVFSGEKGVHVVDSSGSKLSLVGSDEGDYPHYYTPSISLSETRIAYTAYEHSTGWFPWNKDRDWEVVSSELDGSGERRLTRRKGLEFNPVWSPDGTRIAYLNGAGDIYTAATDGTDRRLVVRLSDMVGRPITSVYDVKLPPVWSPDGRHLAFVVDVKESLKPRARVLYTVALDGSGLTRLAEEAGLPAWSPDSRRLAFVVREKDGTLETESKALHIAEKDGSGTEELVAFPEGRRLEWFDWTDNVSWSPDGSEIMLGPVISHVDGSRGRFGTMIFKSDGSSFRTLPTREGIATWSPDGSRIAVHLLMGGYTSSPRYRYFSSGVLYTMAYDGTDVRVLVERDENGNVSAAGGMQLNDYRDAFERYSRCLELAEPGVLKYCEEE